MEWLNFLAAAVGTVLVAPISTRAASDLELEAQLHAAGPVLLQDCAERQRAGRVTARVYPHSGGCGCENTQFRWTDGQLYMMESHGHDCNPMFEGYNTTLEGDCSYFRIRHMLSGRIIANVSESLRHSFFSAVVDYDAKPSAKLWVFGPAHARGNKVKPGPCDGNGDWRGCYIGSWSSTDLTTWSRQPGRPDPRSPRRVQHPRHDGPAPELRRHRGARSRRTRPPWCWSRGRATTRS